MENPTIFFFLFLKTSLITFTILHTSCDHDKVHLCLVFWCWLVADVPLRKLLDVHDGINNQILLTGQKRYILASPHFYLRFCCALINLMMCLAQMITVPLCLVGWCWSIGWGISMVNIANRQLKYEAINIQREREKKEASNNNEPPMLKLDIMSLEAPESF